MPERIREAFPFHLYNPEHTREHLLRADITTVKKLMGKEFDIRNDPVGILNAPVDIFEKHNEKSRNISIAIGLEISRQKLLYIQRMGLSGISEARIQENIDRILLASQFSRHEGDPAMQILQKTAQQYKDILNRPDITEIFRGLSQRLLLPQSAQDRIARDPEFPETLMEWHQEIDQEEDPAGVASVADSIGELTKPYVFEAMSLINTRSTPSGKKMFLPRYISPEQFHRDQEAKRAARQRLSAITQDPLEMLRFFNESVDDLDQRKVLYRAIDKLNHTKRLEFVRRYLERTGGAVELISKQGFVGFIMNEGELISIDDQSDKATITVEEEKFKVKLTEDRLNRPTFIVKPITNLPLVIPVINLREKNEQLQFDWNENQLLQSNRRRLAIRGQIFIQENPPALNLYLGAQLTDFLDRQEQARNGRLVFPQENISDTLLRETELLESTFIQNAINHLKNTGKPVLI